MNTDLKFDTQTTKKLLGVQKPGSRAEPPPFPHPSETTDPMAKSRLGAIQERDLDGYGGRTVTGRQAARPLHST